MLNEQPSSFVLPQSHSTALNRLTDRQTGQPSEEAGGECAHTRAACVSAARQSNTGGRVRL
jgi:hypothetical protein